MLLARTVYSGTSGRTASGARIICSSRANAPRTVFRRQILRTRLGSGGDDDRSCRTPVPAQFTAANNKTVHSACRTRSLTDGASPSACAAASIGARAPRYFSDEGLLRAELPKAVTLARPVRACLYDPFFKARRSCPTGIPDPPRGIPSPCPRTPWGRR